MNKRLKLFATKLVSLNEDTKTATFVISDNEKDRYGERVDQKSWNFKSYLKNPVFLWGHDPSEPENVLGTGASLKTDDDGNKTLADLTFDTDINPKAELAFQQVKRGTLRTVSVGFIPHTEEYEDDVPILKDCELLEISLVPIPANPRAIALAYKAGEIHKKDAQWLMDSMRKEADLVEEQLQLNDMEVKAMTEEQAASLIASMAQLTESVASLQQEQTSLKDQLAELKAPEAEEETDEEKAGREAQEAEDAEAARKAEEEAKAKEEEDSAKGGENDQPGAEDEFDENAELTPEQEAEMDQALADRLAELEPAA